MKRARSAMALAAAVAGLMLGLSGPAHATVHGECDFNSGLCMNNWSQQGFIKMGQPGWPNQAFGWTAVPRCDGHTYVEAVSAGDPSNCPFATVSLDQGYRGALILAFQDNSNGSCIAWLPGNVAAEGACPNFSTGSGGVTGTIFIRDWSNSYCKNNNQMEAVNRYTSDAAGQPSYMLAGSQVGYQVTYSIPPIITCWLSTQQ